MRMNKSQKLEIMVMRAKVRTKKRFASHVEDWFGTPEREIKRQPQLKQKEVIDGSNPIPN